jgi:polyhydroxyalkanoate synthesis repressor PhaR
MAEKARVIKKYPNRRLYDTEKSAYITLTEIKDLVLAHTSFVVQDAKTNEDLTRSILLQIILEEEGGGEPIFSSDMLAHMIRCYGSAMQGVMGTFLERGIHSVIDVQQKLQESARSLYGNSASINPEMWSQFFKAQGPFMQGLMGNYLERSTNMFVDMQKQMQKQARSLFSGFGFPPTPGAEASADAPAETQPHMDESQPKPKRAKRSA